MPCQIRHVHVSVNSKWFTNVLDYLPYFSPLSFHKWVNLWAYFEKKKIKIKLHRKCTQALTQQWMNWIPWNWVRHHLCQQQKKLRIQGYNIKTSDTDTKIGRFSYCEKINFAQQIFQNPNYSFRILTFNSFFQTDWKPIRRKRK